VTRIALYQSRTGIDDRASSDAIAAAAAEAAQGGAAMVFTPEMSNRLDGNRERALAAARVEEDDIVLARAREEAARLGLWIHLGSIALRAEGDPERLVNRSFVIDAGGAIVARYDKIHLFDVDLPTGESWRESALYQAGDAPAVARGTPLGNLGLTICYDLRFPDLFARLAEAGATSVAVPAAFTVPTGQAHWHVLLRARAIEAGLFVIAAAQGGSHEDGRATYGHSLVVDPWGEVIADAGERGGVMFAELDLARVAEVRRRIPALDHRRPIGPVRD
jgi:predicted amidohydrolase